LRGLRTLGRDAFVGDDAILDRVERNVQVAAQACADIALHIVAASGSAAPETYSDALTALARAGIVEGEIAASLAGAVRLRNILVHDYLDVDPGRLFDELGWIEDATSFGRSIERWLESTETASS
jgi:uncharacterized protein YutE (UPF0331/DUF86 family)